MGGALSILTSIVRVFPGPGVRFGSMIVLVSASRAVTRRVAGGGGALAAGGRVKSMTLDSRTMESRITLRGDARPFFILFSSAWSITSVFRISIPRDLGSHIILGKA